MQEEGMDYKDVGGLDEHEAKEKREPADTESLLCKISELLEEWKNQKS
jgi:hypothetical protein